MKYLLDTHVWLWAEFEPARMRTATERVLAQPEAELWLSPVSIWELGVLVRKNRFQLQRSLDALVAEIAPRKIAAVTAEVALEASRIPFTYFDPADNLIAATARVYGLTLVTADEKLLKTAGLDCLPA